MILSTVVVTLAAAAGTVSGTVHFESKSLNGTAVAKAGDAVVYLEKEDGAKVAAVDGAKMAQRNKAFDPRLLVVTAGSRVEFPNDDLVFHNVFSLSEGNEFDLGVYREGTSKAVRFNNPGVVDVFCNIHPEMIGSILVVQNPRFTKVAPDGTFSLELPAGKHTLVAYWTAGVLEKKEVDVPAGGKATVDFKLVDSGRTVRHLNKFGQQYGRYK